MANGTLNCYGYYSATKIEDCLSRMPSSIPASGTTNHSSLEPCPPCLPNYTPPNSSLFTSHRLESSRQPTVHNLPESRGSIAWPLTPVQNTRADCSKSFSRRSGEAQKFLFRVRQRSSVTRQNGQKRIAFRPRKTEGTQREWNSPANSGIPAGVFGVTGYGRHSPVHARTRRTRPE